MLLNASLDTSFWTISSQIGLAPYLFDFFHVYYCQSVRAEIITTDPAETRLVYPQAMLFTVFETDGRLHHAEPEKPISLFGVGKAHAIALAQENQWLLLINDHRPLNFAISLGVQCICIPDFCLLLYAEGKITERAARGYLERIRATTSPKLINQAFDTLDALG